jgi:integrase
MRRIGTDLLFPGADPTKPVDVTKPWGTAVKRATLENFRFHDLRHTAASYLAMSGATTIELAAVLGHRTLQMVKRYAHLADAHTGAVVAAMNERMFSHGR